MTVGWAGQRFVRAYSRQSALCSLAEPFDHAALRPRVELLAYHVDDRAIGVERPAVVGRRRRPPVGRCGEHHRAGFDEETTVAAVDVALGKQVLSENDVVAVQLDMPVGHPLDVDLRDGGTVDEGRGRDQYLAENIDAERVAGGDEEIAGRAVLSERMCRDPNGQGFLGARMLARVYCAMANPFDRPMRARSRQQEIADSELLDRSITTSRLYLRSGSKTNGEWSVRRGKCLVF